LDWDKAIAINQAALSRIVAALIAMVGLGADGTVARLERATYRAVLRVLGPAEAAVRRLIVIAARGLKVELKPPRPFPKGHARAAKRGARVAFQLFDRRKRYGRRRGRRFAKVAPRIIFFDDDHPRTIFLDMIRAARPVAIPAPAPVAEPEPDDTVDASRLGRRLAAIKLALDDLPGQARRLARWRARRARRKGLSFSWPLRIGRPPGHRQNPSHEVDWVLRKCHALASDALSPDTS
jgi:hypothetical protein